MPGIRYQVAVSLDGYVAGHNGEVDWIIMDPDIDFSTVFAQFDTFIMGHRTFESAGAMTTSGSGAKTFVFSRSLEPGSLPNVTIVPEVSQTTVTPIRAQSRKDIWLFGGGELFRSFLHAGLVATHSADISPTNLPTLGS